MSASKPTSTMPAPTAPVSKASAPVSRLPTDLARVVTHVQPALLLAAVYVSFARLVADPVPTLTTALAPLALVQTAYVVCCLPVAGAAAGGTAVRKLRPGATKKQQQAAHEAQPSIPVTLFVALLLSAAATPVLAAIQVLFGAPITIHREQTLLSAAHMALLTVLPLVYVHGVDAARWMELASAASPIDEVFGGVLGCVLGAWVGAVPIPLDWDREWQKWPVTVVTGAYMGYVLGKTLGGSVWKGLKIKFD